MDNKNVFVAIALSMSVLLFWGAFFETPKKQTSIQNQEKISDVENEITPSINQKIQKKSLSRQDALAESDRVLIKNKNVEGSISLKGGILDDLSFINYKKELISKILASEIASCFIKFSPYLLMVFRAKPL